MFRVALLSVGLIGQTMIALMSRYTSQAVKLTPSTFPRTMSTSLNRAVVPVSGPNTLQYRVRLATTADIPAIAQCNVDTLPENYSNQFYEMFLARNSLLCFVAECPENQLVSRLSHHCVVGHKSSNLLSYCIAPQLGYALGKIAEYEVEGQLPFQQITAPKSFVGHVASIAVHERYRGFGVAKELMSCLHHNFARHYHMDRVSLYVRVSRPSFLRLRFLSFTSLMVLWCIFVCVVNRCRTRAHGSCTKQTFTTRSITSYRITIPMVKMPAI